MTLILSPPQDISADIYSGQGENCLMIKRGKAVPLHATGALGGEEVYLLLILDLSTG
jgi:hypothetical protein